MTPETYVFIVLFAVFFLLFVVVWAATGNGVRGKLFHLISGAIIGIVAYYAGIQFYYLVH